MLLFNTIFPIDTLSGSAIRPGAAAAYFTQALVAFGVGTILFGIAGLADGAGKGLARGTRRPPASALAGAGSGGGPSFGDPGARAPASHDPPRRQLAALA